MRPVNYFKDDFEHPANKERPFYAEGERYRKLAFLRLASPFDADLR